jgi:purine-binding chemotaxis protein CheW
MIDQNNSTNAFIVFELANTMYGIHSQFVQQMEMIEQITPVPNAPKFVEGVVFSRGQVIPAINLRVRFGFEKIPYDLRTRLIVIQCHSRTVGLIVDTSREFLRIPEDCIQDPPEEMAFISGKYLSGIATFDNRIILILNVEELIAISETVKAYSTPEKEESKVHN